jgi:hypothetical protein
MDYLNKFTGSGNTQGQSANEQVAQEQSTSSSGEQKSGGFLGGIGDKLNTAAGGGKESEKNEDYLDKGTYISFPSLTPTFMHSCVRNPLC